MGLKRTLPSRRATRIDDGPRGICQTPGPFDFKDLSSEINTASESQVDLDGTAPKEIIAHLSKDEGEREGERENEKNKKRKRNERRKGREK